MSKSISVADRDNHLKSFATNWRAHAPKMTFAGRYSEEMVFAMVAGIICKVHVGLISEPGFGKTDMASMVGRQFTRGSKRAFIQKALNSGSVTSELIGGQSIESILKGRYSDIATEGTFMDPDMVYGAIDEMNRAPAKTLSAAIKLFDPQYQPNGLMVSTDNFVKAVGNEELAALYSRYGLVYWTDYEAVDVADVLATAFADVELHYYVPTVDEAQAVWSVEWNRDQEIACGKVVQKVVGALMRTTDAELEPLRRLLVPRLFKRWGKMIHRMSVAINGDAEYTSVPDQAAMVLKYAMQISGPEQGRKWARFVEGLIDDMGREIGKVRTDAVTSLADVAGVKDPRERAQEASEVLQRLTEQIVALQNKKDDPRLDRLNTIINRLADLAIEGRDAEIRNYRG